MKGGFNIKKFIILLILCIITISLVSVKADDVIIPAESIRIRIVPNSDSPKDQYIKGKVKEELEIKIYKLLKDVKNIDEAREIIEKNLNGFHVITEDILDEERAGYKSAINFGQNYFPEKTYKGVTYKEGIYESILITLGKGNGSNWWCVLFPPLCLLESEDYSETNEVEYQFLAKKIIDNLTK